MRLLTLLLITQAGANPAGALYNEGARSFIHDFGFPIFVAVGLFSLFGIMMWTFSRHFFKNIETSNAERKEITEHFIGVLDGALQNNTEQLTLANVNLRHSCEAIAGLSASSLQQHTDVMQAINSCDARLGALEVQAQRGHEAAGSKTITGKGILE